MYLPKDTEELRAILDELQAYAQVHTLTGLAEALADATLILEMEDQRQGRTGPSSPAIGADDSAST